MSLRDMFVSVGFDIKDSSLRKADNAVDAFKNNIQSSNKWLNIMGNTITEVGNKATKTFSKMNTNAKSFVNTLKENRLALLGTAVATGGILLKSIKEAGDAAETLSMFNQVFKEQAPAIRKWADEYSAMTGRSRYSTYEYLASVQDTLVPMGMARDKAAELSKEITKLAYDLGSFKNKNPSQVISNLTSALVGNHDAIRSYGVVITESALRQEMLALGMKKNYNQLTELEKLQLRYNIIMKGTADAQGDLLRTLDSFNNQQVAFQGNMRNISVTLGNLYLPIANRVLTTTNIFLTKLETNTPFLKFAGGALVATFAITGLLTAIGFIGPALMRGMSLFTKANLAKVFSFLVNPVTLLIGGVIALGFALEDLWVGVHGGKSVLMPLIDKFLEWLGVGYRVKDMFNILSEKAVSVWNFIQNAWSKATPLFNTFKDSLNKLKEWMKPTILTLAEAFRPLFPVFKATIELGKIIGTVMLGVGSAITNGIIKALGPFLNAVTNAIGVVTNLVTAFLYLLGGNFDAAKQYYEQASEHFGKFLENVKLAVWNFITGFLEGIKAFFLSLDDILGGKLSAIGEKIKSSIMGPIDWIKNKLLDFLDWIKEKVDIVGTIKDSIMSKIGLLKKPMEMVTGLIDRFLPHSPAEMGPLSTLDKVGPRLIGTIGEGIAKSVNLLNKPMKVALKPVNNYLEAFSGKGIEGSNITNITNNSTTNKVSNTNNLTPININIGNINNGIDEKYIKMLKAGFEEVARRVFEQIAREEYYSIATE